MKQKAFGVQELRQARRSSAALLLSVFCFSVFVNILMLTGPLFMLQVYDRVLASRSQETLVALFLLVVAMFAMMGLLDFARGRVLARFGARFQSALDERVFLAVLKQALAPNARKQPATGLKDLDAIQAAMTSPVVLALFDVPWSLMFIAAIFIFHPLLGWLALAGCVFLISVSLANNHLTKGQINSSTAASQAAHSMTDQFRDAADIVHAQGMSTAALARWHSLRHQALQQSMNANDWTGGFSALTKASRLLLQSTMLAAGAWLVLRGDVTAGAMIAGSIMLGRALAPIEQAIGQWPVMQRALFGWSRLSDLLSTTPVEAKTTRLPVPSGHIRLDGVTIYAPQRQRPVLLNLNLEIPAGQIVGVIGKSGSGKTSLAKAIMGLCPVQSGTIRLGGADINQYSPQDLGSYVGYLPQKVMLLHGTIAENIARLAIEPDDSAVIKAAQRANAHEMILSLPKGYQTVLHGEAGQLSGGQEQRIALARALYKDPVVLVFDEPNSALDAEGTDALNRALRAVKTRGATALIMTHRPAALAECERLIVLETGRITADGPRDEILRAIVQNAENIQPVLQNRQVR